MRPSRGRTGNLLVHAGNLVKVNDVALVVIHQIEPIFVNFSVPEQHLGAIRRLNAGARWRCGALQDGDASRAAERVVLRSSTTPWTPPPARST